MGIRIDTRGVELSEAKYVNKVGKFLFKIEKIEEDGVTQQGELKFKIFFKGVEVGTKEPICIHSEMFNLQKNSLWRIKQLEVALKAPEIYDTDSIIGRYVVANIDSRTYDKNGETKTAYDVKSWEYSTVNDKLPPIPEAVEDGSDMDDEDEEMPF